MRRSPVGAEVRSGSHVDSPPERRPVVAGVIGGHRRGFSATANWATGSGSWGNYYSDATYPSFIDTSFGRGSTLSSWLNQAIVYGGTAGQIPVGVLRNDFTSVNAPALRWLYTANDVNVGGTGNGPGPNLPMHFTFDTPFNQSPSCGRVVYSDFHVESEQNSNGVNGITFPGECPIGGMTPQEKLLEFMLFDLTSCTSPPTCTPKTCQQLGYTCGAEGDGCGGTLQCGSCPTGQVCGGGGLPGVCGGACTKIGCPAGQNCGFAPDGCGGSVACGTCAPPQTCGGGGNPSQCGSPTCTPQGCPANVQCGPAGDGCGGIIASCGTCTLPSSCGGGGPGMCGFVDAGGCVSLTCAPQGISSGAAGDGCGLVIASCGT